MACKRAGQRASIPCFLSKAGDMSMVTEFVDAMMLSELDPQVGNLLAEDTAILGVLDILVGV